MRLTIVFLLAAYVLSQFYRVFLAVLTPVLGQALGMTPEQLALALGLWFAAFAAMQIPVGNALDRHGPRRTTALLLGLGGAGGAAAFALAQGPGGVYLAMALLGFGCSPVLMAGYYVVAHAFRPQMFSILAAALLGGGSLGNILGAAPMAAAVEAWGWRAAMWGLMAVTVVIAVGLWIFARDPERAPVPAGPKGKGRLVDVLRNPAFLLILPIAFTGQAASSGIRGAWAGLWADQVHGADSLTIGHITLAMSLAMVVGTFAYGPADRVLGSHKRVVLWGNICLCIALACLVAAPAMSVLWGAVALSAVGAFGSSYPVILAHGRGYFAPHMIGRGMTVLNLMSIGGVAAAQFGSAPLFRAVSAGGDPVFAYRMLFLFFLLPVVVSLVFYLFSADKPAAES
ncbi:MFS transporter [Paenirhodobacter sp.]|uniref:MFS transporter n=1 Tax=Paenirhodobacter sp. TaxID=1965326 RepID=UPI003B3E651F